MDRVEWFKPKLLWLKRLALAAVVGLLVATSGVATDLDALIVVGALPVVPLSIWLALIPVLHWKDRYVGGNSGTWGAFLAFETSGWSKIIYWFRHVLPDWRSSGRYRDSV
ncbi:MAG TPA: hypothetical protein VGC74_10280 [Stenotrophomonas sp.]|jgi:hypothetical protein